MENDISTATFYYHVKQLRKKACDVPTNTFFSTAKKQEVVPLIIDDLPLPVNHPYAKESHSDSDNIAVKLTIWNVTVENKLGNAVCNKEHHICVVASMLGDISGMTKIYCVTSATDMRRSIDGLMAIIRDTYQMDSYAHALYLFCGKRRNTLKALYFDRDGFCLVYKRIDGTGRFQWSKNASEVHSLTRHEFRWLARRFIT